MVSWEANHHQQEQQGRRKGPWTPEEDKLLMDYVALHGEGRWSSVAKCSGLNRSGKSCRLRWVNYLRPGLKRGQITPQEEGIIIELHALWGNKWSTIARYLPGRTDNEIKNYWRTHFKKKDKSKQEKRKSKNPKERQQQQKHEWQPEQVHQDDVKANHELEETVFICPTNSIITGLEDHHHHQYQCVPPPGVSQYDAAAPCSSDQSAMDEGCLWGSLWNLDDHPYGGGEAGIDQTASHNCSKINSIAVQNRGFLNPGTGDYSYSSFFSG